MQKMKVAIIIPRPVYLGPSIVMKSLVTSLSGTDNLKIDLFCLDKPKDNESELDLPVLYFNLHSFCFEDYDIIHTSGIRPDLIAFMNRKRIRYHISTIHSLVAEEFLLTRNRLFSVIFSNIWMILWKSADKLVCVSGSVKNYYSEWFSPSKLEVIYNGIAESSGLAGPDPDIRKNIDHFRNKGLKVIGTAAMLTKLKETQLLLHLVTARSEFACIVIGSGKELGRLKRLAKKLGISDRCFFAGFLKNASDYFKYFDFYATTSLSEGFGLTVIEAVREKVPVICSGIAVFRELFTPEEVTFFDPGDINSLSSALDIATGQSMEKAQAAYLVFKAKYTERIMGEKYYELYRSVCKYETT